MAIAFSDVCKHFGAIRALDGVSFSVRAGEVVALLGPNGAGKSTAVSLMLGLRPPDAGTVRIGGMSASAAVQSGAVGAMLQSSGLPPGILVRELLQFVRGLYPRPMPLQSLLQRSGCAALAEQFVERLSGGQVQRVRFAMAIAGDPQLLFLDEPTTGFDVEARRNFWSSIREIAGTGRTVVFATHYLEEADAIADHILVLQNGRIIADGSASSIKAKAGGRSVRFCGHNPEQASLAALPGVTAVEIQGDQVRLITSDSDATVRALVGSGQPFRDLEVGGGGLEEAFIHLVRGEGDVQ